MNKHQQAAEFIERFTRWAYEQPDILAVALVGSQARNTARDDSDIDLVVISETPKKYLDQTEWAKNFGMIAKEQIEDYGMLISLRVWYEDGIEIEYGFTTAAWAATPLDAGTREVIRGGIKVLFERTVLLSPHIPK